MKQCLFGEHLLPYYPNADIALVESEKTCLIAAYFMPMYLWMATGGLKNGFNQDTMKVLQGRKVVLFPDLGGYDEWMKRKEVLVPICKEVSVSNYLESVATDEQKEQGLDLGDFLLMERSPRDILNSMTKRYPALLTMIEALKLDIVEH